MSAKPMVLYVKSTKVYLVRNIMVNNHMWGHLTDPRATGLMEDLSAEDKEAVEYLVGKNIEFVIVDLSIISRIKKLFAWMSGKTRTPSLVINGHKFTRLKQIEEHFQERQA